MHECGRASLVGVCVGEVEAITRNEDGKKTKCER